MQGLPPSVHLHQSTSRFAPPMPILRACCCWYIGGPARAKKAIADDWRHRCSSLSPCCPLALQSAAARCLHRPCPSGRCRARSSRGSSARCSRSCSTRRTTRRGSSTCGSPLRWANISCSSSLSPRQGYHPRLGSYMDLHYRKAISHGHRRLEGTGPTVRGRRSSMRSRRPAQPLAQSLAQHGPPSSR